MSKLSSLKSVRSRVKDLRDKAEAVEKALGKFQIAIDQMRCDLAKSNLEPHVIENALGGLTAFVPSTPNPVFPENARLEALEARNRLQQLRKDMKGWKAREYHPTPTDDTIPTKKPKGKKSKKGAVVRTSDFTG